MKIFIAAVLTLFLAPCFASEHGDTWGAGSTTCGQYLTYYDQRNDVALSAVVIWSQGYLSAVNVARERAGGSPLDWVDGDTIRAYMQKHCRDNPLDHVVNGTLALVTDLGKTR